MSQQFHFSRLSLGALVAITLALFTLSYCNALADDFQSRAINNASPVGTTTNKLAKLTGAPSTATIALAGATGGIIGLCVNSCGTHGQANIQIGGTASCVFDGATTAGDYVQNSPSINGDCHDAGATYPASGQVIGRVLSTSASAGTRTIDIFPAEIKAGTGAAGATGATGPSGPSGPTGANGINGTNGANGATGATGPNGPSGATGLRGATGPSGPTGPSGTNGTNGANGATGATGPAGATGATGPSGVSGPRGPSGASGASGVEGPSGPTGPGFGFKGPWKSAPSYALNDAVAADGLSDATNKNGNSYLCSATGGCATGDDPTTGATQDWEEMASGGATGATGPTGLTGATGPQGPTGVAGPEWA